MDQPGADSRRHLDVGDLLTPGPGPPVCLRERSEVGVVVDDGGHTQALSQLIRELDARPAGQDVGGGHDLVGMGDRRRQADGGPDHELPVDVRRLEQLVDERAGGLEAALDVVPVLEWDPAARQYAMAEIPDRHREVTGTDVDADRNAGRYVESDAARRSTAAAGASVAGTVAGLALGAVGHQATLDQLAEQVRDGRARKSGSGGELGPGERSGDA